MHRYLLIALGAVAGANARYYGSLFAAGRWGVAFPWGTLLVNATGSSALGFCSGLLAARMGDHEGARLIVATGFCGSYTTFSTFAFETLALLRRRDRRPALANAVGSALLGCAAAGLGLILAA